MISVEQLCAGYDGNRVVHEVSFALQPCENLSIIGPNGCGKTTLLRAISGTLSHTGKILIDGQDATTLKKKHLAQKIAMLSQSNQIYFNYSVYDTVMMGRYVHSSQRLFDSETPEDRAAVENALQCTGLLALKSREVDTLSGGQLQRVFLAKLIAQNPDIILLDEPTNHLDLSYQVEMIHFLTQWASRERKIIIGVLHDINLAMMLSDKVLLMENGHVTAFGKCTEVFAGDAFQQAYRMDVPGYMLGTLRKWEEISSYKASLPATDFSK